MRARFLRADERAFAKSVFGRTIPLDDILVTDLLGAGNEPYTEVSGPSNQSMPFVVPVPRYIFAVNMGANGFDTCIGPSVKPSFVRELAKVWLGPGCVARSRMQAARADYVVGEPWTAYNDEQKACLVEDWVRGGMLADDPRMAYIHANIRRGKRA
jgi:hypothetical protein